MGIIFSSTAGRRRLLDEFEEAKKEEARASMSRRQAMERMGFDRVRTKQDDDLLLPETDGRLAEAIRKRAILEDQVCRLQVNLAPDPQHTNTAQIGLVVTIRYDADGTEHSFFLSGYNENFPDAVPPFISYNSPFGKKIIKAKIGDIIALPKGEAEITALEYPEIYQAQLTAKAA